MVDTVSGFVRTLDTLNATIERPFVNWLETLDDETCTTICESFGLTRDRVIVAIAVTALAVCAVARFDAPLVIAVIALIETQSCMIGDIARGFVARRSEWSEEC